MLHQLKSNQFKGLVRLGMVRRITEHIKVAPVIVALVAINMMYVFSALGSSNNAVFKYPAAPASPSALGVKRYTMRPVALCRGRSGADIGEYKMTANRLGYVPAPKLRPWLHSSGLATVRKACIAVLPPHLVVTHAHFTSGNRAFAVLAIPSDLLSSPSVLSGSVTLDPLVVHKAEPMSSVLLFTPFNRACFHALNVRKNRPRYKALGNSWPVPVIEWIGDRIDRVDAILKRLGR